MGVPLGAFAAGTPRRLPHGVTVVRQGELGECLFLVTDGAVRLSSVTSDGTEVVVGILGAGDLFGESALLEAPSPVEARVLGEAELVALPTDHLLDVFGCEPLTAEQVVRLVAARLHRTARALEDALSRDVPARLTRRLLDLAEAHGAPTPDGVVIRVPITQDELARMVGAARETVNRALGRLSARGLVSAKSGTVLIRDPDALGRAPTVS
ncbi:MAG TPA: Crp/Fnr family transcriptional regulator [Actinomycetota bacterium]|nr:Crp/Fnr family transcriptional regulator [Actinomycetota bacterium]